MAGYPKSYFDDVDKIIEVAKDCEDARDEKYGILRELSEEDAERIKYTESNIRKVKLSMMDFMLINAAGVLLGRKPLVMMSDDQQRLSRFVDLVGRIDANHVSVRWDEYASGGYIFVPEGAPDRGDMPVFDLDRGEVSPARYVIGDPLRSNN